MSFTGFLALSSQKPLPTTHKVTGIKQVNQELEQHLCLFVNECQDDWDDLLPLAEFQYNNHVHSVTQQSPFMLDMVHHP